MDNTESDPSDPVSDLGSEPAAKKQKQEDIAPQRRWIFTWNNYPANWEAYFSVHRAPEGRLAGYMGGREIAPTTGTPHIQGWIDYGPKKKGRPLALKLPTQISWRKMRGEPEENYGYCSKEDEHYIAWGTAAAAKPFTIEMDWSLHPWMTDAYECLKTEPNRRDIWWVWEPIGSAGKTFFCKWYEHTHHEQVLVLGGKASDMRNGIVEWREKTGTTPRVILILIARDREKDGAISWQGVEEVKDMIFYSGKYKGGMINGKHPHVMFFANWKPETDHLSEDRLNIVRIPDGKPGKGITYHRWGFPKEYTVEEVSRLKPTVFDVPLSGAFP